MKEQRLRVLKNRMLRIIFGSKSKEAMTGWRELRTEEFHTLPFTKRYYCEQTEEVDMCWHVAHVEEMENAY
jgi:hypothetical protein